MHLEIIPKNRKHNLNLERYKTHNHIKISKYILKIISLRHLTFHQIYIYIYIRKLNNKLYINKPELISETVKTIWDANISSIAEQLLEQ